MTTMISSASSPTSSVTNAAFQSTPILSSSTSAASSDPTLAVSNCQDLLTPYTTKISGVLFDISCETQNLHGDFMSFESSTLENCIEACANFNFWIVNDSYDSSLRCSIINYDSFQSSGGNCWLKDSSHPQPAKLNQSVISASLRGV